MSPPSPWAAASAAASLRAAPPPLPLSPCRAPSRSPHRRPPRGSLPQSKGKSPRTGAGVLLLSQNPRPTATPLASFPSRSARREPGMAYSAGGGGGKPLVVSLNCVDDPSLEQELLAGVAGVEHVSLSAVGSGRVEAAAAVLLPSLAFLPRAAQRRLRPWQLLLCLGSPDRAADAAVAADMGLRLVHVDANRAEEVANTVMALFLGLLRRTHLLSPHVSSSPSAVAIFHSMDHARLASPSPLQLRISSPSTRSPPSLLAFIHSFPFPLFSLSVRA